MASSTSTAAAQAPAAALGGRLRSARGLSLVEMTVMLVFQRLSRRFAADRMLAVAMFFVFVRVTVVAPREPAPIQATDIDSLQRAIDEGKVKPIFFEYAAKHSATSQAPRCWIRNSLFMASETIPWAPPLPSGH
jgi:hypothetical protein